MLFHVRRDEVGPWSVVRVVGEIDLATAPRYRSELNSAATRPDVRGIAVDLTSCDLIDSIGLGVTLGGARRARGVGAAFAVVASGPVRRTFERSRLDEIIDLVEAVDALTDPDAVSDAGHLDPGGQGPT